MLINITFDLLNPIVRKITPIDINKNKYMKSLKFSDNSIKFINKKRLTKILYYFSLICKHSDIIYLIKEFAINPETDLYKNTDTIRTFYKNGIIVDMIKKLYFKMKKDPGFSKNINLNAWFLVMINYFPKLKETIKDPLYLKNYRTDEFTEIISLNKINLDLENLNIKYVTGYTKKKKPIYSVVNIRLVYFSPVFKDILIIVYLESNKDIPIKSINGSNIATDNNILNSCSIKDYKENIINNSIILDDKYKILDHPRTSELSDKLYINSVSYYIDKIAEIPKMMDKKKDEIDLDVLKKELDYLVDIYSRSEALLIFFIITKYRIRNNKIDCNMPLKFINHPFKDNEAKSWVFINIFPNYNKKKIPNLSRKVLDKDQKYKLECLKIFICFYRFSNDPELKKKSINVLKPQFRGFFEKIMRYMTI